VGFDLRIAVPVSHITVNSTTDDRLSYVPRRSWSLAVSYEPNSCPALCVTGFIVAKLESLCPASVSAAVVVAVDSDDDALTSSWFSTDACDDVVFASESTERQKTTEDDSAYCSSTSLLAAK